MTDLVNGTGIGVYPWICRDLDDGLMCNYNYQLTASEPVGGSSLAWSCTAWPVILWRRLGGEFCVDGGGTFGERMSEEGTGRWNVTGFRFGTGHLSVTQANNLPLERKAPEVLMPL